LNLDPSYQPVASPTQAAERSEQMAWFRLGLELLDPGDREVIVLRRYDELAFADIAEHTGTSPDAARMRYQRAVSKLGREVSSLRHNGAGSLDDHDPSYEG
jgi:RNA polymerase sigma factor (sigma-70 family)